MTTAERKTRRKMSQSGLWKRRRRKTWRTKKKKKKTRRCNRN